jgi:hypothetical protein
MLFKSWQRPPLSSQKGHKCDSGFLEQYVYFILFAVPELELKAFTLSHSTSPIFVKGFSAPICWG